MSWFPSYPKKADHQARSQTSGWRSKAVRMRSAKPSRSRRKLLGQDLGELLALHLLPELLVQSAASILVCALLGSAKEMNARSMAKAFAANLGQCLRPFTSALPSFSARYEWVRLRLQVPVQPYLLPTLASLRNA